jgi:hypothetical protein
MKILVILCIVCFRFIFSNDIFFSNRKIISDQTIVKSQDIEFYINDSLLKFIKYYILETDGSFTNKEWLYYNVIFFKTDSSNYFTIWVFTSFPDYISPCIDKNYRYYLTYIQDRKVVFIDKKNNDNPLLKKNNESRLLAKKDKRKIYKGPIYDGPVYYKTFSYKNDNNNISVNKIETPIYSFLDCQKIIITEDNKYK